MEQRRKTISWELHKADAVMHRGVRVIPEARSLVLRGPWGGFVWSRPVAVSVEREATAERLPIVDVTLLVQMLLLALVVLVPLGVGVMERIAEERGR
jgi:hypothetical protein